MSLKKTADPKRKLEHEEALCDILAKLTTWPVDWQAVGEQLSPVRTPSATYSRAIGKNMIYPLKPEACILVGDVERISVAGRFPWMPDDDEILFKALKVSTHPVDWTSIGLSMAPVRSGSAVSGRARQNGYKIPKPRKKRKKVTNGTGIAVTKRALAAASASAKLPVLDPQEDSNKKAKTEIVNVMDTEQRITV